MPRAAPPASPSTTTSASRASPAARPTSRWPAIVRVAELAHLAQHGDPAGGRDPGQDVERGDDRAGCGVVAVVDDHDAAGADHRRAVRGARRRGQPGHHVVEAEARGEPGGGAGQRVVHGESPEGRDLDGPVAGRRAEAERHPVEPARLDLVRAHVGVVGEAVGHRPGARPRGHPAHPLVVGVEDREAAVGGRGQRLDQLGLGVLDRVERADPRQVDRLDRGHDPDLGQADAPRARGSRRRRTCPSRGPPRRARARAAARSAAARPRCSGCPRCGA